MKRKDLKAHIDGICQKRGVPLYFDRFEPDNTFSDGTDIHLEVIAAKKSRATVVFMPGTNAYCLLYGEFLCALADAGFSIVAFDPRGHGQSGGARGSYTIDELLADMRSAVLYAKKRFGLPVAVSGSSQGGITSFYYAAAFDDALCAVCHNAADLSDPSSVLLTRFPAVSRFLKPFAPLAARLAPEAKIPMSLYLDLAAEPVRNMGNAKELIKSDPLLFDFVRLKTLASLGSAKTARPVEQIQTPVQVLHAEKDNIFPADYIKKLFNRLTCKKDLKIYPGLPHYMIADFVGVFAPDVVNWLNENLAAAGV
jgi:alpha-beta hydrolase superfamily lysophospholipase